MTPNRDTAHRFFGVNKVMYVSAELFEKP